MALQTIPGGGIWYPKPIIVSAGLTAFTIDATDEKISVIFCPPKVGNIRKIGFRTGTVTTSDTLKVEIQTVSATDGNPTGSAYGGMVKGTVSGLTSNTNFEVTLGTDASVAAAANLDDKIAIVIGFDSYVAGNLQIAGVGSLAAPFTGHFPYVSWFVSGAWSKSVNPLIVYIQYDDGSIEHIHNFLPITSITSTTFNSTSNPDERGGKYILPFKYRIAGVWAEGCGSGNFDLIIYEGTTVKTQLAAVHDGDIISVADDRFFIRNFVTPYIVQPNTPIYVSMKPNSSTNVLLGHKVVIPGKIAQINSDIVYVTRVNDGAWSEVADQIPSIGLVIDQLDDGVGGSPLARKFVSAGHQPIGW